MANSLMNEGIQAGDRIAGFLPNGIDSYAAMLATASLGAVWTSCSPDFGLAGVVDVVHGRPVKNIEALANPGALDHYKDLPELTC